MRVRIQVKIRVRVRVRVRVGVGVGVRVRVSLLQADQHGVQATVVWQVPVITAEVGDPGVRNKGRGA